LKGINTLLFSTLNHCRVYPWWSPGGRGKERGKGERPQFGENEKSYGTREKLVSISGGQDTTIRRTNLSTSFAARVLGALRGGKKEEADQKSWVETWALRKRSLAPTKRGCIKRKARNEDLCGG